MAAGFDDRVPDAGYRWWYLDGVSDDGRHALTAIVFVGSVFSPWYRSARSAGAAPALAHSAVNVALYGTPSRWCMTERDAARVQASADTLAIGHSRLARQGGTLSLAVDERCAPWPSRLRGTIECELPSYPALPPLSLSADDRHQWQPVAPHTRIRVAFQAPALRWEGTAYVDGNRGSVPLEDSFERWHWSRSHAADGSTRIRYDVVEVGGRTTARTIDIASDGSTRNGPPGRAHALPATRWFSLQRPTRVLDGATVEALETLENAPFYSRSRYTERVAGEPHSVIHESLDLRRFVNPAVQELLPFRAPRRRTR